ncbi:MAG: hypothetical protein HOP17_02185 [Acidobacteria bacterium]|nr:hypothetical protein [Acidobacteriota bacterium]
MKVLACLALFVLLGVAANGQQSFGGKIFAETSAMSEKTVKGAPFAADAVNESVQVLADGNRIVRSSTNKLYRNSEGRFRREITGGSGGSLGSFYSVGSGITILDPVAGQRYLLDSNLRTARVGIFRPFAGVTVAGTAKAPAGQAALAAEKLKAAELKAATPLAVITSNEPKAYLDAAKAHSDAAKVYAETIVSAQGGSFVYSTGSGGHSKYETRKEDLGVQNIEGVEAEGTRTITTIPAGDIGNERPIEIIYEKWYSKELQLVVMSKNSDPRFGEQTYRLTNIVRSEPDPSLFEVPSGFKLLTEPAVSYTISTAPSGGVSSGQNVVWTRPASAPKTAGTVVTSTKP